MLKKIYVKSKALSSSGLGNQFNLNRLGAVGLKLRRFRGSLCCNHVSASQEMFVAAPKPENDISVHTDIAGNFTPIMQDIVC